MLKPKERTNENMKHLVAKVEALLTDFREMPGVVDVVAGYSIYKGGTLVDYSSAGVYVLFQQSPDLNEERRTTISNQIADMLSWDEYRVPVYDIVVL
jgi:hypothetical protein